MCFSTLNELQTLPFFFCRPPETAEAETRLFWRRNWDCETCRAAAASSPSGQVPLLLYRMSRGCAVRTGSVRRKTAERAPDTKWTLKSKKAIFYKGNPENASGGRVRRLRVKFFRKCRKFFLLRNKDFIGDERKILYECGKTKGRKI